MPLKQGDSPASVSSNIATEIKAGKRPDVAAAIAFAIARKAKAKKRGKKAAGLKPKAKAFTCFTKSFVSYLRKLQEQRNG